jgi:hypothetical protein
MPSALFADLASLVPELSPELVAPSALSRLVHAAELLPPVSFAAALECRLAAGAPRVDLLLGIQAEDGGRDGLIAARSVAVLRRARQFSEAWRADDGLAAELPFLWLEFDLPAETGISEPLAFVCLRRGFAAGPLGSRGARAQARARSTPVSMSLALRALAALGVVPDFATRATLARCFDALPQAGDILHIASTHTRGIDRLRVVTQLPEHALCDYLRAIEFGGDVSHIAGLLARFFGYSSSICIDLDIGASVDPVLGLELHYPGNDPRTGLVLDGLVAEGACAPAKKAPLLAWPGAREICVAGQTWPTTLCRELGLKLVYRPSLPLEAKAYLWFGHRFSLFAPR